MIVHRDHARQISRIVLLHRQGDPGSIVMHLADARKFVIAWVKLLHPIRCDPTR